jgi:hypothetical protein
LEEEKRAEFVEFKAMFWPLHPDRIRSGREYQVLSAGDTARAAQLQPKRGASCLNSQPMRERKAPGQFGARIATVGAAAWDKPRSKIHAAREDSSG